MNRRGFFGFVASLPVVDFLIRDAKREADKAEESLQRARDSITIRLDADKQTYGRRRA